MRALQGDFEQAGGVIALRSPVHRGQYDGRSIRLQAGDAGSMKLSASIVVNCAGLHAQEWAHRIEGLPQGSIPPAYFAKGNYYVLQTRAPFRGSCIRFPNPAAWACT